MRGVKEQIKVNRAEERRKQMEEKRMSDEHNKVISHANLPPISEPGGASSQLNGRSHTSESNPFRPGSASSVSTAVTMLPHSLKSYDPLAINSKASLGDSRPSTKGSGSSRESDSPVKLPDVTKPQGHGKTPGHGKPAGHAKPHPGARKKKL